MSFEDTSKAIRSCIDGLSKPDNSHRHSEEERSALLDACEQLKATIESPVDTLTRIMFAPFYATAVRVCKDMGVFNALATANGVSMSAGTLSTQLGVDALLIVRFMRIITALGLAKEISEETYVSLPVTGLLADSSPFIGAIQHIGPTNEAVAKMPQYFEANGYRNPTDGYDGPFQFGLSTQQHFFDWIASHPKQQAALNAVMRMSARNRGQDWFEYYPAEHLLEGIDSERTALVDVGGGTGQNLASLVSKHGSFSGRVVLQDLPGVIDDIKEPLQGVQPMKHNFFEAQPVKGAKAYYMRTVLHDWPEKQALQILERIRAAMEKDSVLLINEQVLPPVGVSLYAAQGDIAMMTQFASLERTHRQWLDLLGSAGFTVVKTWYPTESKAGERALFEARLREQ